MLVIIVPLRNRSTTRDWAFISRLCERSLRSYCSAGPESLRVVLVCRELPEMNFSHPALSIISEEFPDPGPEHDAREHDKWRKLKRGLVATRDLAPAHYMFADADDLLHRRVPGLVAEEPESHGWYFPVGYAYEEPRGFAYRWPDFDRFCGTSAIVRCRPEDLPATMDDPTEQFFLLMQGHPVIRAFMEERHTPLQPVRFPAAIYLTGTGENHSGIRLRDWRGRKISLLKLLRARPVTAGMRRDFGLTRVS